MKIYKTNCAWILCHCKQISTVNLAVLVPGGQNKVTQSQIHGGIPGKFWKLIKLVQFHHIWTHTQSLATLIRLVEGLEVWAQTWNWGMQLWLIHYYNVVCIDVSKSEARLPGFIIPTVTNLSDFTVSNGCWISTTFTDLLCGCTALQWSALIWVRDALLAEPDGLIPTQSG